MVVVHSLGKNTTRVESIDVHIYTYQYARTINNGPLWITFSNNLEELEDMNKKEVKMYKPENLVSNQWEEIERLNVLDLLLRSKR
jgi:hypothetical protein